MIPILALIAQIALTPLPTPSGTPTFFATPTQTPTAEIGPTVACPMIGDVANCTAANLNHPRQLAVDGTLIGAVVNNGPFTITFAAGSGAHKIQVEGFTPIAVNAP